VSGGFLVSIDALMLGHLRAADKRQIDYRVSNRKLAIGKMKLPRSGCRMTGAGATRSPTG
jgi:hypothetical protein